MRPPACAPVAAPIAVPILALLAALAPAACLQTVVLAPPSSASGGADGGASGGAGGGDGGPPHSGWCSVAVEPPPDVVIALDRSSSMNSRFADGTRLSVTQDALRDLMTTYQNVINFGYQEFPSGDSSCRYGCCASRFKVQPGPRNAFDIERFMTGCQGQPSGGPNGGPPCQTGDGKPTADVLMQAGIDYGDSTDFAKRRYVLLMTDGDPTCSPDGAADPETLCAEASAQATKLHAASIDTIVVAVNDAAGGSACLDAVALQGGDMHASSSPFYFPARDPSALKGYLGERLQELAASACHISLGSPALDPTRVTVQAANTAILPDPFNQNGWSFDPGSAFLKITVYGPSCGLLQASDPRQISVYGCAIPQH